MPTVHQSSCLDKGLLFSIVLVLFFSLNAYSDDINPSGYQPLKGNQFFLLTDSSFTSNEQAIVRLEIVGRREYFLNVDGVDIVVYRVPDPIDFLKQQKNLHRPKTGGIYRGEGLANALNYLWDSWYKKSRLAWQKIFSYKARKTVTEHAPILKQTPAHTYHTTFENNPQFEKLEGFEFVEQFRYPMWQAKPIGPPKGVTLSGSSSEFIAPKEGNIYIPIGEREPGLYLVEAIIGQFRANTLVFVSDTVAITKISSEQLLIWTVNKNTSVPSPNSTILLTDGVGTLKSGLTDNEGILMMYKQNPERSYIIGEDAQGGVFISENFYYDSEIYDAKVYMFTDRPLYKPGDTVYLKLMGRIFEDSKTSFPLASDSVRMTVFDPLGTPIVVESFDIGIPTPDPSQEGNTPSPNPSHQGRRTAQEFTSHQGRGVEQNFTAGNTSFILPELAASGGYAIHLEYQGKIYTSAFRVAQYTKPHYEIDILLEKENFNTQEPIRGKIQLTYPSGKPVAQARVTLNLRTQKLSMVAGEIKYLGLFPLKLAENQYAASDQGVVEFELPAAEDPSRYILRVLSVDNASYRVTATKEILIEAGLQAFSITASKMFSKVGEDVLFLLKQESVFPEEAGETPALPRDKLPGLRWEAVRLEDQSVSSGEIERDKHVFSIAFAQSGSYTIYVKNAAGVLLGSVNHWVEGAELMSTPGSISIVLDKTTYKIGETAKALILFSEKVDQALLTMERDQVDLYALLTPSPNPSHQGRGTDQWISLERESEYQWKANIPITEAYSPNITFSIAYVLNGIYVFQNKGIKVEIPTIDIAFKPNLLEYYPGEKVIVDVKTTIDDHPVEAALTISVVDEMIYVLQPEIAPGIADFFYHRRRNQVRTSSSLTFHTYDVAVPASGEHPGPGSYNERPLKLRERPRREEIDTALWLATLKTDESGHAQFSFKMPDSLTRWRITGRAMSKDGLVGQKTAYLKSSKDFYLKWTGPKVFRQSDQPRIHLVAFNLLVKPTPTDVTFFVEERGEKREQALTLQPGSNYIDVDLKRLQPGYVKTGILIEDKPYDELETKLALIPDWWLSTKTRAFEITEKTTTFAIPEDSFNVRLSLSQGISEGFLTVADRLIEYPYGCVEQTSSRLIPLCLAFQSMQQLSLSPRVAARLRNLIEDNRLRLVRMAGPNATFGWWGNMTGESTFMTAYAYYADWHAANALGIKLPSQHWENLLEVYKNTSAHESLLTNTLALWLATEIGLPTRTLFEGLIEKAAKIPLNPPLKKGGESEQGSYVLTGSEMPLQTSLAIYLLDLAARDLQLASPGSLKKLAAVAEQHLSTSQSLLAQAMLVLGKSKRGLSQKDKINVQHLLSDLADEVPTIDRALSLIFLNKAIDLTMTDVSSVRINMGELWEKHETELERPIWYYTGPKTGSSEIMLDTEPPQGLAAHLIYDSYAKDASILPITIKRNLYRLKQTGSSKFDTMAVDPDETIHASDLYVDEITVIPDTDAFYRYGVLEVSLPPGAEVESTTWGVKIADFDYDAESNPFPEARHISGDLAYTIPVEVLDRPLVFHHLVRFSQTGAFTLPRVRYYRMYAPAEKAYESENEPDIRKITVQ